jgi:hypothetical protein
MIKLFMAFFTLSIVAILYTGCAKDCEPNLVDPDEIIYLNILGSNGRSVIRYTGNVLPGDSVRVTNLSGGAQVPRFLTRDSILTIENYDKNNNAVNTYKIEVGAPGVRKPDTLEVITNRLVIVDNCTRNIERARFKSVKVNTTVRCTSCNYNQVYLIQK